MAKEQKRSHREIKKPKKAKEPAAAPAGLTRGVTATGPTPPKPKKT